MNERPNGIEAIAENILNRIEKAQRILVVCSKPIDHDSLGTALACRKWLLEKGKDVKVVNFFRLTENMRNFPDAQEIEFQSMEPLDQYDLVITVDSSSWTQLFRDVDGIAVDHSKIVNIDHHKPDSISQDVPDATLREESSSAAEVLYTHLLAQDIAIDSQIATYLYLALVGDTGNFRWAIGPNTMKFKRILEEKGADVEYVIQFFEPSSQELTYSQWAHSVIEDYVGTQTKILDLSQDKIKIIEQILGTEYWADFDDYFKKSFFETVSTGFNYLIMLKVDGDELKISWRTRGEVPTIEMMQAVRNVGFTVGGHRNAGGGFIKFNKETDTIEDIKKRLLAEIRSLPVEAQS